MTDDLVKRIAALEAELAALKAKAEGPGIPESVKGRKPWPKWDPTEGMRMPPSAAKAMAVIVPDVKGEGFDRHAWEQTKPGVPGGFGSPAGPSGASSASAPIRSSGWVDVPDDQKAHAERFTRIQRQEEMRKKAQGE